MAVAAVHQKFGTTAQVSHNEHLVDRLGHSRQYDVVIRASVVGASLLGIIECKDTKKRVGSPEVEALIAKTQDLRANFVAIASRSGFTKPALEKAEHHNIGTIGIQSADWPEFAPRIMYRHIMVARLFTHAVVSWTAVGRSPECEGVSPLDVTYRGSRVLLSFLREQVHLSVDPPPDEGKHVFERKYRFRTPRLLRIGGLPCRSSALLCRATVRTEYFFISSPVGADIARLDYRTGKMVVPPGSAIHFNGIPTVSAEWTPASKADVEAELAARESRGETARIVFFHFNFDDPVRATFRLDEL